MGDGARQNGWLRLLSGGKLTSKWGTGMWDLLPPSAEWPEEAPLLLVTFNLVEHALRLIESASDNAAERDTPSVYFDVVSKRRLVIDGDLAEVLQPGVTGAPDKDPRD